MFVKIDLQIERLTLFFICIYFNPEVAHLHRTHNWNNVCGCCMWCLCVWKTLTQDKIFRITKHANVLYNFNCPLVMFIKWYRTCNCTTLTESLWFSYRLKICDYCVDIQRLQIYVHEIVTHRQAIMSWVSPATVSLALLFAILGTDVQFWKKNILWQNILYWYIVLHLVKQSLLHALLSGSIPGHFHWGVKLSSTSFLMSLTNQSY